MFSIGEFSKITGLSVKTLRFYHEKELLAPTQVDPQSGYRYYDRAAASTLVRFTQFHAVALHGGYPVFLIPDKALRVGQELEADTLIAGILHLFVTGWHLLLRAPVDDTDLFCP